MSVLAVGPDGDLATRPILATRSEGVAQSLEQRLHLLRGEWQYRVVDGVPYDEQVLGRYTPLRDAVVRAEVLAVQDITYAEVTSEVRATGTSRVGVFTIRYRDRFNDELQETTVELPT